MNCCWCILIGTAVKDSFTSVTCDDELSLLDVSQESVVHRMVSTPLQGHPAAMDIGDVVSSIHGNLICVCFVASVIQITAALRSTCGHYIFALWFLSIFFYSSPNLSGCRLDVYHASTHGVALV